MPQSTSPLAGHRLGAGSAVLVAVVLLATAIAPWSATAQPFDPSGNQRIGDSADPTEASVLLSQAAFADGEATAAVIGRNDVFADNLAGAGLATTGPLLLVDPGPAGLPPIVAAELARVLRADSPCDDTIPDAYVLGGEAAVGAQVVADLEASGYCVERLAGPTRVETAVEVATEILVDFLNISPDQPDRGPVFVARDDNPADSSSAGAYAARNGIPIVVTPADELHPAVRDFLTPGDTAFTRVTLLGGTAALSTAVEDDIAAAVAGFDAVVDRVAGPTRDGTAVQIATQLWPADVRRNIAIVNGFTDDFWTYALPGGVAASRADAPLLYVQRDSVPPTTTEDYLRTTATGDLLTIGPESQVSEATRAAAEAALGAMPPAGGEPALTDLAVRAAAQGAETVVVSFQAAAGGPLADPPPASAEVVPELGLVRVTFDEVLPGDNPRIVDRQGLVTDVFFASDGLTASWVDIFTADPVVEEVQARSNPARLEVTVTRGVAITWGLPGDTSELGALLTPTANATVQPGPLEITGYASPFEAQATLVVSGPAGVEVNQPLQTAGWTEWNGTFSATVDTTGWTPGEYTITIDDDNGGDPSVGRTLSGTFTLVG